MTRKNLPILMMIFLLLAVKAALGQATDEGVVSWDPNACWDCYDDAHTVMAVMVLAPIFGVVFGLIRAASQSTQSSALEPLRLK